MELTKKNILIISPEAWGKNKLSKHHYALHLAKRGNQVFFLQTNSRQGDLNSEHDHIKIINYIPFKGISKLPEILATRILKREWKRVFHMMGVEPDLIWSFDNSVLFDLSLTSAVSVSHIVDLNQDYQFKRHAESADLCLGSTPYVLEKLKRFNPNSFFLNHGCVPRTQETTVKDRFIGIYIGNLNISYLDRDFVKTMVVRFPEIQFTFIGSKHKSNLSTSIDEESEGFIEWLDRQVNVELTGTVEQQDLDEQLKKADFYFLAYKTEHHKQVANPHKVMELLSTGKMVFSFPLECYKDLNFPAVFGDFEAYLEGIAKAKKGDQPFYNPHKKAQIDFALKHSYDEQIKRVEACLKNL